MRHSATAVAPSCLGPLLLRDGRVQSSQKPSGAIQTTKEAHSKGTYLYYGKAPHGGPHIAFKGRALWRGGVRGAGRPKEHTGMPLTSRPSGPAAGGSAEPGSEPPCPRNPVRFGCAPAGMQRPIRSESSPQHARTINATEKFFRLGPYFAILLNFFTEI